MQASYLKHHELELSHRIPRRCQGAVAIESDPYSSPNCLPQSDLA